MVCGWLHERSETVRELTEKEWDRFFESMAAILNMPGTRADKASRVKDEASLRDEEGTLQEFAGWFARPETSE